ncbi:MAG: XdhC family protein [Acidobacteria bacterium]|nr:XdhC family protein [Acidobacteriota bacterium]
MSKQCELWEFVAERLRRDEDVMLLVVAESTGSSPGRAGYKMAVAEDGELIGSIGGGVMEVRLVELAKSQIQNSTPKTELIEQEHRKNSQHPSGMICSGRQTVILKRLIVNDLSVIETLAAPTPPKDSDRLVLTAKALELETGGGSLRRISFERKTQTDFVYSESLNLKDPLFVIGGGHCALALSELMSRMDFRIHIFDDRPSLNTLDKNEFADEITIIDSYENIGEHIPDGDDVNVVVMTLGYASDAVVIRQLAGREFKYFGVLGSKAKMATLLKELTDEGFRQEQLESIRTPIGLPINSHTPEEIAVSIAAEIIQVRNS